MSAATFRYVARYIALCLGLAWAPGLLGAVTAAERPLMLTELCTPNGTVYVAVRLGSAGDEPTPDCPRCDVCTLCVGFGKDMAPAAPPPSQLPPAARGQAPAVYAAHDSNASSPARLPPATGPPLFA